MNLKVGPQGAGAFLPSATIPCTYVDKKLGGTSPKFLCRIGAGDEVMVKYGRTNGEVYGEVLASRLLWALGFAADRMYPVTVVCRGCPRALVDASDRDARARQARSTRDRDEAASVRIESAVIERRMPGVELEFRDEAGWSWDELDWADPEQGGAPRAHRDALKLLAVFLQHTDSKREQQRIVCTPPSWFGPPEACRRPILMVSDLGLTFGRANRPNAADGASVSLIDWRRTPVWKEAAGCTGQLRKSFTGTLADPDITEEGRRFLAALLAQLSDRQLRDLFGAARVTRRLRVPDDERSGFGTIDEWVTAFKEKRQQVVERRCA